jgi:UDP-arabinose 4-epimerase
MIPMSDKESILVTGGAGYIGSHACKALAKHGFQPIALDNLVNGPARIGEMGTTGHRDIQDETLVQSLIEQYGVRSVIHFAAFAEVEESVREPQQYYENNFAKSVVSSRPCDERNRHAGVLLELRRLWNTERAADSRGQ